MVFVDGQNLVGGAQNYDSEGIEIDVEKLIEEITDNNPIRSYWFDVDKGSKERFYRFLQTNGFRVDKTSIEHSEAKGINVKLACEMMHLAYIDAYEEAILVSGDTDFARVIKKVQDRGKRVRVVSFEDQLSTDLLEGADEVVRIDDIASKITREEDYEEEEEEVPYLEIDS